MKHVAILTVGVPLLLEDVLQQTPVRADQKQVCGKYITMFGRLEEDVFGRLFEAQHAGRRDRLDGTGSSPEFSKWLLPGTLKTSLRQLTGMGQSRGVGI